MDALRHEARTEGRYRLDPVDEHNRMIPNAPAAYVCIHASESPSAPPPTARPASPSMDHAVIEAIRLNSELARSIVDKFPLMLESAAALVRAADGAGMPAREPRALPEPRKEEEGDEEDDEDDEDEDEDDEEEDDEETEAVPPKAKSSSWAGLLETLIPFVAPAIMNALSSGKLELPGGLGALFDCRRASPKASSVAERTVNTPSVMSASGQSGTAPARRTTSSIRVSEPRDAPPTAGEAASTRAFAVRDVSQAADKAAPMCAFGPRDVTQPVGIVAPTRASGLSDAAQAAGEATSTHASGPRDAIPAAGEMAPLRASGPRDAGERLLASRRSGTRDPRDARCKFRWHMGQFAAPTNSCGIRGASGALAQPGRAEGGVMRSINIGVRVKQPTVLTVELPALDGDAVVQIAHGASTRFQTIASSDGLRFPVSLSAGDHVLVVDTTLRPAAAAPLTVTTGVDVAFWSAARLTPTRDPRLWIAGIGTSIAVIDPDDPWPWPPAPQQRASDAYLSEFPTSNSSIAGTMRQLLDASPRGGVNTAGTPARTHALLIGIDRYGNGAGQDGAIYQDLRGCVYDILEVEKLLRSQVPGIRITRMLAPRPSGPGSDVKIPSGCVPTYTNIVARWRELIDAAQPGDAVYVHISSHGGRASTQFPGYKASGIDESIAPCDINDRDHGRYLRDVEIATLLDRMARRELLTTLVLDSCHSGNATRSDDARARRGDRADLAPRGSGALGSDVATPDELAAVAHQLAHSPSGPQGTWRIDSGLRRASSFNTVIAACRGHEAAYEYSPVPGVHCGALTYFWRKALAERNGAVTYRRLFDQVFCGVRNLFAHQTPLLLGEPDRMVFGTEIVHQRPSLPVLHVDGDHVVLRAGAATQIEVGMRLAIVPPGQLPELVDLSRMAEVEVTRVIDGVTSRARRVPGTGVAGEPPPIAIGARGVVRAYSMRLQRTVRLAALTQSPTGALDCLTAAIAADSRKLLTIAGADSADYQVFVNSAAYWIGDAAGIPLPYVPPIAITDDSATLKVVDQLVHLSRYSNVLGLANNDRDAPLSRKLEVEILDLPGYPPGSSDTLRPTSFEPGRARIRHDSYFCLRIRNASAQYLQIAVIDLQPDWSIDTLVPDAPELSPAETRDLVLHAELADPASTSEREVLKVLATRDPVDAGLLSLPPLGDTYLPRSPRGSNLSSLDELFRILHQPLIAQRNVALASSPSSGWTASQTELEIYREIAP